MHCHCQADVVLNVGSRRLTRADIKKRQSFESVAALGENLLASVALLTMNVSARCMSSLKFAMRWSTEMVLATEHWLKHVPGLTCHLGFRCLCLPKCGKRTVGPAGFMYSRQCGAPESILVLAEPPLTPRCFAARDAIVTPAKR